MESSHLLISVAVAPCQANRLYHRFARRLQRCAKICIRGGPVTDTGRICNTGRHIKDTDLFWLVIPYREAIDESCLIETAT